jgi:hypothetical protein
MTPWLPPQCTPAAPIMTALLPTAVTWELPTAAMLRPRTSLWEQATTATLVALDTRHCSDATKALQPLGTDTLLVRDAMAAPAEPCTVTARAPRAATSAPANVHLLDATAAAWVGVEW